MSNWWIYGCCWCLSLLFIAVSVVLYSVCSVNWLGLMVFDGVSFYLSVLVFLLGCCSIVFNLSSVSRVSVWMLVLSLFFSVACFHVNHSVLFWCFYELAMLPLLYLLFRDSPYSERFVAGWYFSGYLLLTSLPLILVLSYMSFVGQTPVISQWGFAGSHYWVLVLLGAIFFTKVPLCPFHTWLPIVHAEATSIVSTCLSGYIMKLGVLGVFRFVAPAMGATCGGYLTVCCVAGLMFLLAAAVELDGKRWLAVLSLSHIVIPFLGFFVCGWDNPHIIFFYSLGHGVAAGLVFGLLWVLYNQTNTRNWVLVKGGVNGRLSVLLVVFGLLTLSSFPPTIQFFSEVSLLTTSVGVVFYSCFWYLYLFVGGLVPLALCGLLLIRTETVEDQSLSWHGFGVYLLVYIVWVSGGVFFL